MLAAGRQTTAVRTVTMLPAAVLAYTILTEGGLTSTVLTATAAMFNFFMVTANVLQCLKLKKERKKKTM